MVIAITCGRASWKDSDRGTLAMVKGTTCPASQRERVRGISWMKKANVCFNAIDFTNEPIYSLTRKINVEYNFCSFTFNLVVLKLQLLTLTPREQTDSE